MEFPEPHGNDGRIAARSSRITSRYGKSGLMMFDVFFFEGKVHYAFARGFARRIIYTSIQYTSVNAFNLYIAYSLTSQSKRPDAATMCNPACSCSICGYYYYYYDSMLYLCIVL